MLFQKFCRENKVRNRTVEMIDKSRGFFSIRVLIDDPKKVGNLEVTKERFIRLRMTGWKKKERSLKFRMELGQANRIQI